jgi:hypothetical protein
MELITDYKAFHAAELAKLPAGKRAAAIAFLKERLPQVTKEEIRQMMSEDSQTWWTPHHLWWGMSIRNLLREHGFGEKELGVSNLGDVYIGLLEAAVIE